MLTTERFAQNGSALRKREKIPMNEGRVASKPPADGTTACEARCILIVDDNVDLAEATAIMLKFSGFDTITAHSGREAIERARLRRPDTVLLDIGLPDMDGYALARKLRQDVGLFDATMIAISANDPNVHSPNARAARFEHYLIKPVDIDFLLRILTHSI
jgi:CheY-like chemotaxis protein